LNKNNICIYLQRHESTKVRYVSFACI